MPKLDEDQVSKDIETLKDEIYQIRKSINTAKDTELFNIVLDGKVTELFRKARTKLVIWVSPIVIALLVLGVNFYKASNEVIELKDSSKAQRAELDKFFKDKDKLRIFDMLVASFYKINTIEIPLIISIRNSSDYSFTKSIKLDITMAFSHKKISNELIPFGELYFDIDHRVLSKKGKYIRVLLERGYPSIDVKIQKFESYKYLAIRILFENGNDFEPGNHEDKTKIKSATMGNFNRMRINGIQLNKMLTTMSRTSGAPLKPIGVAFEKKGQKAMLQLVYFVDDLFKNAKHKYEKLHLADSI